MKLLSKSIAVILFCSSAYGGAKLKLQNELYFTDTNGVANPTAVASSVVGELVRIYKTDKEYFTGIITEVIEDNTTLRVFGKITNSDSATFGFTLAKGGIFAGAIVDVKNEKTYILELDLDAKGYILKLTNRYDKPVI